VADERSRRSGRAARRDPTARTRWSRVRIRSGDLSPGRAALAADAGDPAASRALGDGAPAGAPGAGGPGPEALEAWAAGLGRWGPGALLRALFAVEELLRGPAAPGGARQPHQEVQAAVEAWLDCAGPRHRRAIAATGLGRKLQRASARFVRPRDRRPGP